MKKITLIISALALVFSANAQTKGSSAGDISINKYAKGLEKKVFANTGNRAAGDSLMYMPLPSYYVNPTDAAGFTIVTQDVDGLSPQNTGAPADFSVYFSVETGPYGLGCATCSTPHGANFYHPWETPGVDSAFFWDANSWFNPIGQADNWLMFGPITIPAGGATLKWFDRTARYRDGYQVLVSSTFSPVLDFGDFTGAAIFTETDDAAPSATYAIDTTWELKSVAIPASFNGMQIAFAFHHNAYDMDQLWLDEIHITEDLTGIEEFVNGVKFSQNMPNPFSKNTAISYELESASIVTLNVFDVTGKKVAEIKEGNQTSGKHAVKFNAENLSAGVYYYSLKVGDNVTTAKKMVLVK